MRAKEFINEGREKLPAGTRDPLAWAYYLPGIRNNDAYRTYRMGVAIARARADAQPGTEHFPEWEAESVFAENSIFVGSEFDPGDVLDKALEMTGYGGGKVSVGSKKSHEPHSVNDRSPVSSFKGYPR